MEIATSWFYLYCLFGSVQLMFYLFFRLNFPVKKERQEPIEWEPITLIIAFKNEEEQLKKNIPVILNQNYPAFEIIMVNDHSNDGGEAYLKSINDERITLVNLIDQTGKKAAVQKAITLAKNDFLLFTDADCQPCSSNWMKGMVLPLHSGKQIVVGYGRFSQSNRFLVRLQQYENFMNNLQNFSYANSGRAFMGVGRNLAYNKSVYKKSSAFQEYGNLTGGDDDLIVNEMSTAGNTEVVFEKKYQTVSAATTSWKGYFHQKRRHLEVGRYYRKIDRLQLGTLGLSQLFFNLLFITLLIRGYNVPLILSIFVLKTFIQILFYAPALKRLEETTIRWWIPILEALYLPIISCIGLSQYLWKVERWK